jgi:hypothetical protein
MSGKVAERIVRVHGRMAEFNQERIAPWSAKDSHITVAELTY